LADPEDWKEPGYLPWVTGADWLGWLRGTHARSPLST
jgi:hypothetical protein